jgi:hypothetical protein
MTLVASAAQKKLRTINQKISTNTRNTQKRNKQQQQKNPELF